MEMAGDGDHVGLSSPVSLQKLMNRYDNLVARLNDGNKTATDLNEMDKAMLRSELRFVCRLLLAPHKNDVVDASTLTTTTRIPWSDEQRNILRATSRGLRQEPRNHGGEPMDGEMEAVSATPSNSLMTQLSLGADSEVVVAWTYGVVVDESIVSHVAAAVTRTCQWDASDDETNSNLLATMTRAEIAAEEEQLWRMAQTPIPHTISHHS